MIWSCYAHLTSKSARRGLSCKSYCCLGECTRGAELQYVCTYSLSQKLDGCHGNNSVFSQGYPAFGAALQASGRNITYSCSWPAYLGKNESTKPFEAMIAAGCNLWRNWEDIANDWDDVLDIINHFGDYSQLLQKVAGPGHWNDVCIQCVYSIQCV
jgi:hypothetical protein